MSIRIGSLIFERPFFMAPMEGITDVPFRRIVRKHGCGVVCTQMIHSEALVRGESGRRLRETIAIEKTEDRVGLQLCGSTTEMVAEAAKRAVDLGAAFIDLNMGCPAKNIVKLGAGAALLLDPERAGAMVREVVRSVPVPVTVKIRAGWDDRYRNALEMAQILEREGASLVAVHARTKEQKHTGEADWNLIRELKERLTIPVVGNGGLKTPEDIDKMFKLTGADGVMCARGALGNPWLFEQRRPTVSDIRLTLLEHLDLHLSFYENRAAALLTFRKHLVWYTTGLANATEFRWKLFQERSLDVVLEMIHRFFDQFDPQLVPAEIHAN